MNKIWSYILISFFIISCSEGDLIEDNTNFTADLENCFNGNDFVFYIVDTDIHQAFSLNFTSTSFSLDTADPETPVTITLNSTSNLLIYRQFNSAIDGASYFCSSIPPSDIMVTQELISESGTAEISYTLKETLPTETVYTRTIVLNNITLEGNGIALRKEFFLLGSDEVTVPN
ncbi:hypothetical protein [Aquimarina sp. 2201CG5-10]|uniref:hypothetical protein n=1 Tax=Aquimarina callyspongiae TaxID=3098150 RepID=UPI002AB4F258|nr:hypothetical protein [Aquimarina sp. 2201CG5-10]MDY8138977.1 hypothetical protein [Aquimarina sp. 2201CG5-10]